MKISDLLKLPNIISCFRILLMPVYVFVAIGAKTEHEYMYSSFLLMFIACTDFLDGFIARKLNMVTELGKFLDPLADKLFQLAIATTLLSRIPGMWVVYIIFMIKEWSLFFFAAYLYKKHNLSLGQAKWCGKISTVIFYSMTF